MSFSSTLIFLKANGLRDVISSTKIFFTTSSTFPSDLKLKEKFHCKIVDNNYIFILLILGTYLPTEIISIKSLA